MSYAIEIAASILDAATERFPYVGRARIEAALEELAAHAHDGEILERGPFGGMWRTTIVINRAPLVAIFEAFYEIDETHGTVRVARLYHRGHGEAFE